MCFCWVPWARCCSIFTERPKVKLGDIRVYIKDLLNTRVGKINHCLKLRIDWPENHGVSSQTEVCLNLGETRLFVLSHVQNAGTFCEVKTLRFDRPILAKWIIAVGFAHGAPESPRQRPRIEAEHSRVEAIPLMHDGVKSRRETTLNLSEERLDAADLSPENNRLW